MEIHRHHSSKTVILILTSVLSFAFVACGDASEKGKEKFRVLDAKERGEESPEVKALKALGDITVETCNKKGKDSPECWMAGLAYFKASCDIDEKDFHCNLASDFATKLKSYDEAYAYCDKACKLAPHQCLMCGLRYDNKIKGYNINDPRRALEFYQRGCEHGSKQACDLYNKIKVVPTPTPSQTQAQPSSTPSTAPTPAAVQPIPTPSHDPTPTQAQPFPDIDAPAQIDTNAASDDPTVGGSTAQRYGIQYIREITYKGKSTPSWIILKDPKGRYCAIVTSSKYPILEIDHYCIPFSGNDEDLKDSFAGNRVAEIDFPDHKQCKNIDTVSNNDYCNRFYKAFEEVAQKEQFLAVTDICRNDPDVDSVFWSRVCKHLALEHDLD